MKAYPYIAGRSEKDGYNFDTSTAGIPFDISTVRHVIRSEAFDSPDKLVTEVQSIGIDCFLCIGSRKYVQSVDGVAGDMTMIDDFSMYLVLDNRNLPAKDRKIVRSLLAGMIGYEGYITCDQFEKIQERGSQAALTDWPLELDAILRKCRGKAGNTRSCSCSPKLLGVMACMIWMTWWRRHCGNSYIPVRIALPGIASHAELLAKAAVFLADELLPLLPIEVLSIMSITAGSTDSGRMRQVNSACYFLYDYKGDDPSVLTLKEEQAVKTSELLAPLATRLSRGEKGYFISHLHNFVDKTMIRIDFDLAWRLAYLEHLLIEEGDDKPANAEKIREQIENHLTNNYKLDNDQVRIILFPVEAAYVAHGLRHKKQLTKGGFGQHCEKLIMAGIYKGVIAEESLNKYSNDLIMWLSLFSLCSDGASRLSILLTDNQLFNQPALYPVLEQLLENRSVCIQEAEKNGEYESKDPLLTDEEILKFELAATQFSGANAHFQTYLDKLCITSANRRFPDIRFERLIKRYGLNLEEYREGVFRNIDNIRLKEAANKPEYASYFASLSLELRVRRIMGKWAGEVKRPEELEHLYDIYRVYKKHNGSYSEMDRDHEDALLRVTEPLGTDTLSKAVSYIKDYGDTGFALKAFSKRLNLDADPVQLGNEYLDLVQKTGVPTDAAIREFVKFLGIAYSSQPIPQLLWENAKELLICGRTKEARCTIIEYYEKHSSGIESPNMHLQMNYLLNNAGFIEESHLQFGEGTKWRQITLQVEIESAIRAIQSTTSIRELVGLQSTVDSSRQWMNAQGKHDIWSIVLFESGSDEAKTEISIKCKRFFQDAALEQYEGFLGLVKKDSKFNREILRAAAWNFLKNFPELFASCGEIWLKVSRLRLLSRNFSITSQQIGHVHACYMFSCIDAIDQMLNGNLTSQKYFTIVRDLARQAKQLSPELLSSAQGVINGYLINNCTKPGMNAFIASAAVNVNLYQPTDIQWGSLLNSLRHCAGVTDNSKTSDAMMLSILCNLMAWFKRDHEFFSDYESLASFLKREQPLLHFNRSSKYKDTFRFMYNRKKKLDQNSLKDYSAFGERIECLVEWLFY